MTSPGDGTARLPAQQPRPDSPDEIAADIAVQRERLAADIEELKAHLDVKTRVRTRARGTAATLRSRVTTPSGAPHPAVLAAVGVVLLLVAGAVRRRTS